MTGTALVAPLAVVAPATAGSAGDAFAEGARETIAPRASDEAVHRRHGPAG